jgi:hypothetical protein
MSRTAFNPIHSVAVSMRYLLERRVRLLKDYIGTPFTMEDGEIFIPFRYIRVDAGKPDLFLLF